MARTDGNRSHKHPASITVKEVVDEPTPVGTPTATKLIPNPNKPTPNLSMQQMQMPVARPPPYTRFSL